MSGRDRSWASARAAASLAACVVLAGCAGAPPKPSPMAQADPEPAAPPPRGPDVDADPAGPDTPAEDGAAPWMPRVVGGGATTARSIRLLSADASGDVSGIAWVCLTLPVGSRDGPPGISEWSAHATIEVPPEGLSRPAAAEVLERMGGGTEVRVGAATTQFSLWMPVARWDEALEALISSLAHPGASRSWMQRVRTDLVETTAAELAADPLHLIVSRYLVGDEGGPRTYIEGLQDATPADTLLFRQKYYQPEGAVLSLWIPGTPPAAAAARAAEIIGEFKPSPIAIPARPSPLPPPDISGQILWVPGEGPTRVAIAMGLAEPRDPQAAELRCMLESLTMGGVGGRLEAALLEEEWYTAGTNRGLPLRGEWLDIDNRRFLLLRTQGSPQVALRQVELVLEARRSIASNLPSPSETDLGSRRARLMLRAELDGPQAWALRAPWDHWLQGTGRPLSEQLARLEAPETLVLREAAGRYLSQPFSVVLLGGAPPQGHSMPIQVVDMLPSEATQDAARSGLEGQLKAARTILEGLASAFGGRAQILRVAAYDYEVVHKGSDVPEVTETLSVRGRDVRRSRQVLGTTIETTLEGDRAVESAGAVAMPMEAADVQVLRLDLERHPLQLLRSWLRGTLQFRLVGERTRDQSRIAVLECMTPRFARMRVEVDLDANLIREIEWWRGDTVQGTTHIRERWEDYRQIQGLRIPMHRIMELDDGATQVDSTWNSFKPGW